MFNKFLNAFNPTFWVVNYDPFYIQWQGFLVIVVLKDITGKLKAIKIEKFEF